MNTTKQILVTLVCLLLYAPFVIAQEPQTATVSRETISRDPREVTVIIQQHQLRFAVPASAQEVRLEVFNQAGEVIYDSGLVNGPELSWALRNASGEAVPSGLYAYTLSVKDANAETPALRRGHLILENGRDRLWVTSQGPVGAEASLSGGELTASTGPETNVVGARIARSLAERGRQERDTQGRLIARQDDKPVGLKEGAINISGVGTTNRITKWADGPNGEVGDSTLTDVGGNIGIGVTSPITGLDYRHTLAPFLTRDIGTTNFGTPQSAIQIGVTNTASRNVGVGPSFLFFSDDSAGQKEFLGRLSAGWENPTNGQEAGFVSFNVRANSADTGALTERLRITSAGNVGIGTANPLQKLHLSGQDSRMRLQSTRPDIWTTTEYVTGAREWHTGVGGPTVLNDVKNKYYVFDATAGQFRMAIDTNGNVGIGATNPQAKLQVEAGTSAGILANSQGNAILGYSTAPGFAAIYGENTTSGSFGVYGKAGSGVGVRGDGSPGVVGFSPSGIGVFGRSNGSSGKGVYGEGNNSVDSFAVYGDGAGGIGVYGRSSTGGAGLFEGTVFVQGGLFADSLFVYNSKNFVEPHPTDPNKMIAYVSLEGPEAGTYFRGSGRIVNGVATIQVPEDFRMVTDEKGLTVQATPMGEPATIWLMKKSLDKIELRGSADVEFDFLVNGVRRLSKDYQPIVENTAFIPRSPGDNWFRNLQPEALRRLKDTGILNEDGSVNMKIVEKLDAYKRRMQTPLKEQP